MTKNHKVVIVDLFAGGGGASNGVKSAVEMRDLVIRQFIAINHWADAIATHEANHPDAQHYHCAVEEVDPRKAVNGRIVHLLVAGPSCTHFSVAQGGRPRDEQSRSSPWSILNWLKDLYVRAVVIENVPEFQKWGPLGRDGKPLKSKQGETFAAFIKAIEAMNYVVEWRVLNAADYGDATSRRRLFILARRLGTGPIQWPEPTNQRTARSGQMSFLPVLPSWHTAREIIDWDIALGPETSIFNRAKPLAPNTINRCIVGLYKFGLRDFILSIRGGNDRYTRAASVEDPLGAIAAENPMALVKPFVLGQQSCAAPRSVDEPLPTVASAGAIAFAHPYLIKLYGTNTAGDVDQPLPAVTAEGTHLGMAQPFIIGAGGPQGQGRPRSVDDPLSTVLSDSHLGVAHPFIIGFHAGVDNARRVHDVDYPLPTQDTSNRFGLVQPFIVTVEHGGDSDRSRSLDDPLPTIIGNSALGLAQPYLIKFYSQGGVAQSVDEPLGTVTTKERFALCVPLVDNYLLIDIRLRMLHWRELAAAMSFPSSYIWLNSRKKPASRKVITKLIGNAWPNQTGRWLCYTQLQ